MRGRDRKVVRTLTGVYVEDPSDLDIDHLVPLKNAYLSGGWKWDTEIRERYANYLDDESHLVAVTARANRSKGAKGPEEWRPPDEGYWCEYAFHWTEVKTRWQLTMTKAEADAVMEMLSICSVEVDVVVVDATGIQGCRKSQDLRRSWSLRRSQGVPSTGRANRRRPQGSRDAGKLGGGSRSFPKAMVPSARDGKGDGVVCER